MAVANQVGFVRGAFSSYVAANQKDKIFFGYGADGKRTKSIILNGSVYGGNYDTWVENASLAIDTLKSYFSSGEANSALKLGSANVGGSTQPIYFSNGLPAPITVTAGDADTPVWISNGQITECDEGFADYLPLSGGTMTGNINASPDNYVNIGNSVNAFADIWAHNYYIKGLNDNYVITAGGGNALMSDAGKSILTTATTTTTGNPYRSNGFSINGNVYGGNYDSFCEDVSYGIDGLYEISRSTYWDPSYNAINVSGYNANVMDNDFKYYKYGIDICRYNNNAYLYKSTAYDGTQTYYVFELPAGSSDMFALDITFWYNYAPIVLQVSGYLYYFNALAQSSTPWAKHWYAPHALIKSAPTQWTESLTVNFGYTDTHSYWIAIAIPAQFSFYKIGNVLQSYAKNKVFLDKVTERISVGLPAGTTAYSYTVTRPQIMGESSPSLTTARSLWGQSFNGTSDVSGDMTNVGTIMPKSTDTMVIGAAANYVRTVYTNFIYAGNGNDLWELSPGSIYFVPGTTDGNNNYVYGRCQLSSTGAYFNTAGTTGNYMMDINGRTVVRSTLTVNSTAAQTAYPLKVNGSTYIQNICTANWGFICDYSNAVLCASSYTVSGGVDCATIDVLDKTNGRTGSRPLIIQSDGGTVGIGYGILNTNAPSSAYKLDVSGNVRITKDASISGTLWTATGANISGTVNIYATLNCLDDVLIDGNMTLNGNFTAPNSIGTLDTLTLTTSLEAPYLEVGSGTTKFIAPATCGTAGQVLTSRGSGLSPTWETPATAVQQTSAMSLMSLASAETATTDSASTTSQLTWNDV